MGEVYSHLSEEERQVIQIEVGNGASIRGIRRDAGPQPSASAGRSSATHGSRPTRTSRTARTGRKAEKAGAMDRRAAIAPACAARGRPQEINEPCRLSHDRLWAQVAEWLGCGLVPLLISGRLRPVAGRCALRVCPETIYRWVYSSRPLRERGAVPARGRRRRHGGRRTSRLIPGRVPISRTRRRPTAGARSAIGSPTASSEWDATCTPRWERVRSSGPLVPDKTAGESVGAQLDMFLAAAGRRASSRHARQRFEFAHHERLRDDGRTWPRVPPTRTQLAGEATRTATA